MRQKPMENVLILQGGGSLGAFGCGVYKALARNRINLDILAGTSIGGINAAIIAGSKDDSPEKTLEEFWLDIGENSIDFAKCISTSLPFYDLYQTSNYFNSKENFSYMKSVLSFLSSSFYGNNSMFVPRWRMDIMSNSLDSIDPLNWTYLYDNSPLEKTLEKYIDYNKLRPNGKPNGRLIITAVNVLTAEPLTFDSNKQEIASKHILATSGYPFYFFPWVEIEKDVFAWDGGLLSNTPLREVIDASPVNDKQVFLVENYPKNTAKLPTNIHDVLHRAHDIVFSDKTAHNIKMSKVITMYLEFIDELYDVLDKNIDKEKLDQEKWKEINHKYNKFCCEHGAEIKKIFYITRNEEYPHIYENADFSLDTIKESIREGEKKTNEILHHVKKNE